MRQGRRVYKSLSATRPESRAGQATAGDSKEAPLSHTDSGRVSLPNLQTSGESISSRDKTRLAPWRPSHSRQSRTTRDRYAGPQGFRAWIAELKRIAAIPLPDSRDDRNDKAGMGYALSHSSKRLPDKQDRRVGGKPANSNVR